MESFDCKKSQMTIEGLSRRKPYVTFHFVIFKIPSFTCVIGFSFIPNIRKIDNKVKERKRRQKIDERNILVISFEPSINRSIDQSIDWEREREREREYSTDPKSRVGADIPCVAGGLHGCESAVKAPIPRAFALKLHPHRSPAMQARADNASGIFSWIDSIHRGFRKTTPDIGSWCHHVKAYAGLNGGVSKKRDS